VTRCLNIAYFSDCLSAAHRTLLTHVQYSSKKSPLAPLLSLTQTSDVRFRALISPRRSPSRISLTSLLILFPARKSFLVHGRKGRRRRQQQQQRRLRWTSRRVQVRRQRLGRKDHWCAENVSWSPLQHPLMRVQKDEEEDRVQIEPITLESTDSIPSSVVMDQVRPPVRTDAAISQDFARSCSRSSVCSRLCSGLCEPGGKFLGFKCYLCFIRFTTVSVSLLCPTSDPNYVFLYVICCI
jgi:hypothetical protein